MKTKFTAILSCFILSCLVSCDPSVNHCQWWIKNDTDQTLKLTHFSYVPSTPAYVTTTISPGDSIPLYRIGIEKSRFNRYFEKCVDLLGSDDIHWQVLSDDDVVLKTWNYSDFGAPDQRFFKEQEWRYYQGPGDVARVIIEYSWTFEISSEDIDSE